MSWLHSGNHGWGTVLITSSCQISWTIQLHPIYSHIVPQLVQQHVWHLFWGTAIIIPMFTLSKCERNVKIGVTSTCGSEILPLWVILTSHTRCEKSLATRGVLFFTPDVAAHTHTQSMDCNQWIAQLQTRVPLILLSAAWLHHTQQERWIFLKRSSVTRRHNDCN